MSRTLALSLEQQQAWFLRLVDQSGPGGCWLWIGMANKKGYGLVTIDRRRAKRYAHRRSHELFLGPIAEGLEILHSCDVRRCVNPAHLRAGTHAENIDDVKARSRWANSQKTHCVNGHAFTPENTIRGEERGRPRRSCRECARAAGRRFHHNHKEERAAYMRDYHVNRSKNLRID